MFRGFWRLAGGLSAVLIAAIWFVGAAAQPRDRPEIDSNPGGYLRGVFFIDAVTGWAVGGRGLVLVTHDAGQTWQPQFIGTIDGLHGVQFSGSNGWMVGNNGFIAATRDGGQTWQKQNSGTTADLLAVYALRRVGARVAWAVGRQGTILKTIDGGESWLPQKSGTNYNLWSADFVNETTGWAVGENGLIIATIDGGANWQPQKSGTQENLYGINFGDRFKGWAVGTNGTVIATNDGENWKPQAQSYGSSKDLWSIYFSDARLGWATGAGGAMRRTRDGGSFWASMAGPTDRTLLGTYFVNERQGWAVGIDNVILATRDGGDSWQAYKDTSLDAAAGTADKINRSYIVYVGAVSGALVALIMGPLYLSLRSRRDRKRLEYEMEKLRFRFERQTVQEFEQPPELPAAETNESAASQPPIVVPEVPDALLDIIRRGDCTLFWGGGLSAQAGYPTWREALAQMIERKELDDSFKVPLRTALNAGRFSLVVDSLATRLTRNEIIKQLSDLWGSPRPVTPAIDAVSKLPFANVVTSVWDPMIERAFARRQPIVVMGVSSESLERLLSREAFCIARLWGALTHPESVLFTPSEYRMAVAGNPTFGKYVASLTLSQSHLFIGASLETIEEYLSATPRGTSSHTHYALVPESDGIELARDVFKERGVELLVFRPTPGWRELSLFLTNLVKSVEALAPVASSTEIEAILLRKIELQNIGPFKSLSLDLDPNWNVLLGNNGTGKSTVLRAIALVVCGDDSRALVEGGRLLRTDARAGFVQLTVGSNIYRTVLVRDDSGGVQVNVGTGVSPLKFGRWVILGFPSLRGVSGENPTGPTTEGSSSPVIQDVLPILVGQVDSRLSSLKQWLVNLDVRSKAGDGVTAVDASKNQKLRDHFFKVFNAFVPGINVQFEGVDRKTWQVNITSHGAKIGIEQLSQGTNSILGWVGAMLQRIYEIHGYNDDDSKPKSAVVLIDEIDAHLHPGWQQRIVGALSNQFPAVQFIATSHSPLIVGELEQRQVYRMRRQPGGEVVASYPAYPLKGLGVAGLLTSDLFDLESALDQKTQSLLEKQRALSAKDKLTDTDRIELEDLKRQLDDLGFNQQMRDPEYTRYLQEKDRLLAQMSGSQPATETGQGEVPASIKELIREAVARATKSEV